MLTMVYYLFFAVRLPLLIRGFSFKIHGNPLIKGIEDVLKTGVKQMLDYLKSEDYKRYVNGSVQD